MPCDYTVPEDMTVEERKEEVDDALDRLEKALAAGTVKVKVGPSGSLTFVGWSDDDRRGMSDLCAYRKLASAGSSALRMAIAKAEALAGRSIDKNAIAAGVHSHDGGKTWGKH